ncbi:MAG: hypothetical protein RL065_749 [Bacteroidota bacterium]|jgi:plasmid stabilization system protein ParE
MVEIKWTDFALNDLDEIGNYIALDSPRYASITVSELFNAPTILKKSSQVGRVVPEIGKEEFRELIKGNYHIVYKIISTTRIDILTVHHSKRLLSNHLFFE